MVYILLPYYHHKLHPSSRLANFYSFKKAQYISCSLGTVLVTEIGEEQDIWSLGVTQTGWGPEW